MSFAEKYKPTTQKALFHKDVVSAVRKWITYLEARAQEKMPCQHTLLIHGPTGSSKSTMVQILFKGFNIIQIDSNDIRNNDKMMEIVSGIVGISDKTLANIGNCRQKDKYNVVVVDNIELCEKSIVSFVDTVHAHANINVPIIMISNDKKYVDFFHKSKTFTSIEVKKPSLLELIKLVTEIDTQENLMMSKENMKKMIEHSVFDCRQLLFLLEQWKISKDTDIQKPCDFETFLSSVQMKHVDLDLHDKIRYITNTPYDTPSFLCICMSEPSLISNSLYQNYLNLVHCDQIDLVANIANSFSDSQIIQSKIYDQQFWQLYDPYTVLSCLEPSFYIQKSKTSVNVPLSTYRDISLNFANSFEEVKKASAKPLHQQQSYIGDWNNSLLFSVASIILKKCKDLDELFVTLKKGKNTSKKEKFSLYEQTLLHDSHKGTMSYIVDIVYQYKLFEINHEHISFNINSYESYEYKQNNIDKIDLRILKRFLNIFSLASTAKAISSNMEVCLKMALLEQYITNVCTHNNELKTQTTMCQMDHLTIDLDDLWKLK